MRHETTVRFLSMSNVQLRKALGMVTPVERLVVRNALKRCSSEFFQFSVVRFKGLFVYPWFCIDSRISACTHLCLQAECI